MGQQEPDAVQHGKLQSPVLEEEQPQALVLPGYFPAAADVHGVGDVGTLMDTRLSKNSLVPSWQRSTSPPGLL